MKKWSSKSATVKVFADKNTEQKYQRRYEWKNEGYGDQLWDHQRGCWIVWAGCGNVVGVALDTQMKIIDGLDLVDNDIARDDFMSRLNFIVNIHCSCGGSGPEDDPCVACQIRSGVNR